MTDEHLEYQRQAFKICDVLDNNKGEDILLLDVATISSIADYFILVTATSKPHALAMIEKIEELMDKDNINIMRRDGIGDGRWIVADYGNIVIHIFTQEMREFYHLEKLWSTSKNTFTYADIQKIREKEEKQKVDAEKKAEKAKKAAVKKEQKKEITKQEKSVTKQKETKKKNNEATTDTSKKGSVAKPKKTKKQDKLEEN